MKVLRNDKKMRFRSEFAIMLDESAILERPFFMPFFPQIVFAIASAQPLW